MSERVCVRVCQNVSFRQVPMYGELPVSIFRVEMEAAMFLQNAACLPITQNPKF
jgi:hypothetical protein